MTTSHTSNSISKKNSLCFFAIGPTFFIVQIPFYFFILLPGLYKCAFLSFNNLKIKSLMFAMFHFTIYFSFWFSYIKKSVLLFVNDLFVF